MLQYIMNVLNVINIFLYLLHFILRLCLSFYIFAECEFKKN